MGRGRPKGSKNKPKTETPPVEAVVKKKPWRKLIPKTLTPKRSEKPTESVHVVFHLKSGSSHRLCTSKEEGFRIANEWAAFARKQGNWKAYNCPETIAGDGWAILTSEVAAIIAIPVATEPPKKKRGRPAGKK